MKRLLTTLVILASILGSAGAVWADVHIDFTKGYKAEQAGNFAVAAKWYRKALKQGNQYAANQLNAVLAKRAAREREAKKWQQNAKAGGWWQDYNEGKKAILSFDNSTAMEKWKPLAEQGYCCQYSVALLYAHGDLVFGVIKDRAEAAKWYRKAAEQGDVFAQYQLASMYHSGGGIPLLRSLWEPLRRFILILFREQGVTRDYAEEAQWYLGLMYRNGDGVARDHAEAVKWFRKSAAQGFVVAQVSVGTSYLRGSGVLQDTIAAVMWFDIAAVNGHKDDEVHLAAEKRDKYAGYLSSAEIVKAQQMAKRCMASGYKDCD